MKAIQIHRFGTPEVLQYVDAEVPQPGEGEVLVRMRAAGVGPWDALIRTGRSALVGQDALPVTLGSDIAGEVHALGPGVSGLAVGDEVYGVTNHRFTGGYAEFAVARADMLARKPASLDFAQAASVPVVAVTAWQMLFDHAKLEAGQTALILGASGNVGSYAVQLAHSRGISVIACGGVDDGERLRAAGAGQFVHARDPVWDLGDVKVDAVIDAVGGELQARALPFLKPGGALISAVSVPSDVTGKAADFRSVFFYVDVGTQILEDITRLIDARTLSPRVGIELPLSEARVAHDMLEGVRPAPPGKIVLSVVD